MKMYEFIAVQKPYLSKNTMSARIVWASTHELWAQEKWNQVMFTDESSFTVRPKKNRMQMRRKKGENLRLKHTVPFSNLAIKMCQCGVVFLQEDALRRLELLEALLAKHIEFLFTTIFFLSCTIQTTVLRHLCFKRTIVGRIEQKILLYIYKMKKFHEWNCRLSVQA